MTPDHYIKVQLGEQAVAIALLRSENDQLKEDLEKLKNEHSPARDPTH